MKQILKNIGAVICRFLLNLLHNQEGMFGKTKLIAAALTFALYSAVFTWKFALLIMIAIGFHESGHIFAMRQQKIKTSGFYFIPFFGGLAIGTEPYKTLTDKVIVAFMGPIWGMLLALITWFAYLITGNVVLGVAAFWQATLNIFNLLPINPLDGGQVIHAICASTNKKLSTVFSVGSILVFLLLFAYFKTIIFLLVAGWSAYEFWQRYKHQSDIEPIPLLSRKDIVVSVLIYGMLFWLLSMIIGNTYMLYDQITTIFLQK